MVFIADRSRDEICANRHSSSQNAWVSQHAWGSVMSEPVFFSLCLAKTTCVQTPWPSDYSSAESNTRNSFPLSHALHVQHFEAFSVSVSVSVLSYSLNLLYHSPRTFPKRHNLCSLLLRRISWVVVLVIGFGMQTRAGGEKPTVNPLPRKQ